MEEEEDWLVFFFKGQMCILKNDNFIFRRLYSIYDFFV